MSNRFYLGVFLVLLSAVGFGLLPIFTLYAYKDGVNVITLLLLRFSLAALFFFIYLFFRNRKVIISRKQLAYLFLLGAVFYTLQSTCYISAVKYISASLTALVFYSYPVFVVMLAFIIKQEILTKKILLSIGLCLVGLLLVLASSVGALNYYGILLALGAAIIYSCYIVLGNRVVRQLPFMVTSAFVALFAAVSLLAAGLAAGSLNFHFEIKAWVPILGIVLVPTVISMCTFFYGLELIGSAKASILSTIEPLVTIGFSSLLFHDRLTWLQLLGGAAVLMAAVLVVSARQQNKIEEPAQIPANS